MIHVLMNVLTGIAAHQSSLNTHKTHAMYTTHVSLNYALPAARLQKAYQIRLRGSCVALNTIFYRESTFLVITKN